MSIHMNTNMSAVIANATLTRNDQKLSDSIARLSSGYKVNHAKDNPSGIAISKKMRAQIRGLTQATSNSNDAISVVQTAEGALNEIEDMLQRLNELAIHSANGVLSDNDRSALVAEAEQLKSEINRISSTTEFNGSIILDGTYDLKGYTDSDSVKVLTYTDEVKAGYYQINNIKVTRTSVAKTDESGNTMKDEYGNDIYEYKYNFDLTDVYMGSGDVIYNDDGNGTLDPKEVLVTLSSVTNPVFSIEEKEYVTKVEDNKEVEYHLDKTFDAEDTSATIKVTGEYGFSMELSVDLRTCYNSLETYQTANNLAENESVTITLDAVNINLTGLGAMTMQIGASENQELDIRIPKVSVRELGLHDYDISTADTARDSIDTITKAIDEVSSIRSRLGAYENRLEHSIKSLDVTEENMHAADGRIMDVNMAEEMTNYSSYQVLVQAGTSLLAQANERPSQLLQLLQ